ncbi:NTPase, partial [Candidatus Poribacteria bacterium]|nr:NTPase [Candidatus Poribacteria bacterium]
HISGGASLIPSVVGGASSLFKQKEEVSKEDNSEETAAEENVDFDKLIDASKPPSVHLDVRSFRDKFSSLIAECDIDSLVVLIDDLDRCSPERIIDNLEAIKLFLNVEQTAFVIGADPRIVRHAIETRYKPSEIEEQDNQREAGHRLVLDYLEKLIQIPYHLPRLSPAEVETYMVLLFCLRDLEKEKSERCLAAFDSLRTRDRYSVFGYTNIKDVLGEQGVPESLSKSLIFCATSAPSITEGLKGNPRQVKRFLNAFVLRKQLAEVAKLEHIHDEILVKLMVLEYGHPEQYSQLYEWQTAAEGFPEEIQNLESSIRAPNEGASNKKSSVLSSDEDIDGKEDTGKESETRKTISGWETSSIQKWIAMEPALSDVDLRDYFWISRDRLQSTFSGISMVSPIVRRILEGLVSDNAGKRNIAVDGTVDLNEDEINSLLTQLEERVYRHPDQKQGYDAFIALVEKHINGAAEKLVYVLDRVPDRSIPPAVGIPLSGLAKKTELMTVLQPTIDRLAATKSRIGRALKKRNAEI